MGGNGEAQGDTLYSIEGVIGSDRTDYLYGGFDRDILRGEGSADYLNGSDGNDLLAGGSGSDILLGGAGADELRGDAGTDFAMYLSLRATAAWAAAAGVATLSDVALLYRLQQMEGWLGAILAALLGEVVRAPGELARPVQIVDATSLGWPGPRKGTAWRIHARLELAPTRFSGFVLTDGTGAERLDRFTPTPGAIVLADRCYARHGGMAAVWGQGADLVVRYGLSSSALRDPNGARVTLNGVLRRPDLPDRLDLPVRLPGPGDSWHAGRLILVRRPGRQCRQEPGADRPEGQEARRHRHAQAAARGGLAGAADHARCRHLAGRAGHRPLPAALADRARLQAAEKPGPARRPAGQGPAAGARLHPGQADPGLVGRPAGGRAPPPFSPGPGARAPPSLWRLTRLALLSLLAALLGTCRLGAWRAKRRRLERLLAEPPRRRARQLERAQELLT